MSHAMCSSKLPVHSTDGSERWRSKKVLKLPCGKPSITTIMNFYFLFLKHVLHSVHIQGSKNFK